MEKQTLYKFVNDTDGIVITAIPTFDHDHSLPEDLEFIWLYKIIIENQTNNPHQLVARMWNIIDSDGCVEEVYGYGVVGEQPVINPGESYEYTSKVSVRTSSAIMAGNYEMLNIDTGDIVIAVIPSFALESPYNRNIVN
ncbi:MAG: Co2+/Mg2+ efflux protein ApaG [Alphaproteobacteria bacterium]|nr:Co2+/Mg2+ efflux protein ApaG [Alphaproteobacteria bacterium]OJV16295.1 MAG: Co2+/Mg2+ efflux protein ApaG [Alphaproteobacteria bacterium 33-17]